VSTTNKAIHKPTATYKIGNKVAVVERVFKENAPNINTILLKLMLENPNKKVL